MYFYYLAHSRTEYKPNSKLWKLKHSRTKPIPTMLIKGSNARDPSFYEPVEELSEEPSNGEKSGWIISVETMPNPHRSSQPSPRQRYNQQCKMHFAEEPLSLVARLPSEGHAGWRARWAATPFPSAFPEMRHSSHQRLHRNSGET